LRRQALRVAGTAVGAGVVVPPQAATRMLASIKTTNIFNDVVFISAPLYFFEWKGILYVIR
jgi:hypothetical protein